MIPPVVVVVPRQPLEPPDTDIPRSDALRAVDVYGYAPAPDPVREAESSRAHALFGSFRMPRRAPYLSDYPWYYSQAWHPFGTKVPQKLGAQTAHRSFTPTYDQRPIVRGNPVAYGSQVPVLGERF